MIIGGTEGLFAQKTIEITEDLVNNYRNQGLFFNLTNTSMLVSEWSSWHFMYFVSDSWFQKLPMVRIIYIPLQLTLILLSSWTCTCSKGLFLGAETNYMRFGFIESTNVEIYLDDFLLQHAYIILWSTFRGLRHAGTNQGPDKNNRTSECSISFLPKIEFGWACDHWR